MQSEEAIYGFVSEETRQRRALSKQMAEAVNDALRVAAGRIAHLDDDVIDSVAAPQARHFIQRCLALQGGHEAYIDHRILSGMVHPGPTLVDFYLDPDDNLEAGCSLHREPKPVGHDAWLFMNVASMMWAQRAVDHLEVSHRHRSELRRIANELGVAETLKLTPGAAAEVARAQQVRRRESRKGRHHGDGDAPG